MKGNQNNNTSKENVAQWLGVQILVQVQIPYWYETLGRSLNLFQPVYLFADNSNNYFLRLLWGLSQLTYGMLRTI